MGTLRRIRSWYRTLRGVCPRCSSSETSADDCPACEGDRSSPPDWMIRYRRLMYDEIVEIKRKAVRECQVSRENMR